MMDKVVWLVAGNKGGVGKSVVGKALAGWLRSQPVPVIVVDGDERTPDVARAFEDSLPVTELRLDDESGWREYADFIGSNRLIGHIVTNLPDGVTDKAMGFLERFRIVAEAHGFTVKVLFVMNNLPDGLHLLPELRLVLPRLFPVKNLHFGPPESFVHFDQAYGLGSAADTVLFPGLHPRIMSVARESGLAFSAFANQRGNTPTNFTWAKIAVANWYAEACEALDETLYGE
ncbi:ParA family protein [Cupriavidus basilensis]|uniref:Uncharacterized protein n=1 Tax=Cupriavidus basilensis TaxID=68895 RepID=A0A643FWJ0_9BURK|nr:ParA family protein [Cupriavidus basilensis]QOT82238.1 hypothetical protein F7R26_039710 [Cupriavidus basilensis]